MRFLSFLLLPSAFVSAIVVTFFDGDNPVHDDGYHLVTPAYPGNNRIFWGSYYEPHRDIHVFLGSGPEYLLFANKETEYEGVLDVHIEKSRDEPATPWTHEQWEVEGDVLGLNVTEGVVAKKWWLCGEIYYFKDKESGGEMPCGAEGREVELRTVWGIVP